MRISKITLLKLGVLACFMVAYQFTAHGVTMKERASLYFGYFAFVVTALLLAAVFWLGRGKDA